MRLWPKPGPVLAPGWIFTTRSVSTRAWVIACRGRSTRKACGHVDDRRCRPAVLPPLPEPARKAGKCSPSPTSTQAPRPTMDLILVEVNDRFIEPVAPVTAIGADIETGRVTP